MKKYFLFFWICFCFYGFVFAEERVAVRIPSEDEQQVQNLIENIKNAINEEDSKSYLSCMTKDLASKSKKKVVMMFMNHDMEADFHKFEIMDSNKNSIEFVVKYTLYQDSTSHNFVSNVLAERDQNKLLISKESVLSKNSVIKNNNQPENMLVFDENQDNPILPFAINNNCENGQCLPAGKCPPGVNCAVPRRKHVPVINDKGFEVLEGVSLFNDENGNPDPNGIMWLPPGYLWKKFPDKYGVPDCIRVKMGIK